MTQYQAIKQLYQEAEKKYREYSERYSGEWISGHFPGLDKMLAYKRMLLIMEAESDSALVDKYVNMSDIEIIHNKLNYEQ